MRKNLILSLLVMTTLVIGMLGVVSAAHDSTVTVTTDEDWLQPDTNTDFIVDVTNNVGGDSINRVVIYIPLEYSDLECGDAPTDWTLTETDDYCRYDTLINMIAAGDSEEFVLSATTSSNVDDAWLVTTRDSEPDTDDNSVTPTGWTIQDAIDDADAGDTINVPAGVYEEQIEIDKDLTLRGAGKGLTTILSPITLSTSFTTSAANKAIVYAHDASEIVIEDLTVDGDGRGNGNNRFDGVAFYNAGGEINNIEILDIAETPLSGSQHGVAIYAYVDDAVPRTLSITENTISGYQKNGMALSGEGLDVLVDNNVVTGIGPTSSIAQNGIQISFGAIGTITNNIVEDNVWTGTYGGSNDPTTDPDADGSAGILLYMPGSDNIEISGNILTANQFGIWTVAASEVEIHDNTIVGLDHTGNAFPTGIAIWDSDMWTSYFSGVEQGTDALINNNQITDNEYGLISRDYTAGGEVPSVNAENNWWGTFDEEEIPLLISGDVDFEPFWYDEEGIIDEPQDWVIALSEGMNTFSIPLMPVSTDIEDVLPEAVSDNAEKIWSYQQGEWVYNTPISSGWSTASSRKLQDIEPGYGYIIFMTGDAIAYGNGEELGADVPPEVTLTTGWNLIGHYGLNKHLLTNVAFTSLELGDDFYWNTVLGFDDDALVSVDELNPNKAYWLSIKGINLEDEDELRYFKYQPSQDAY